MQAVADPVFGPDGPTPWKLLLVGFLAGVLCARLLLEPQSVRVVRFREVPLPDGGPR
jgi:hypothetical protein